MKKCKSKDGISSEGLEPRTIEEIKNVQRQNAEHNQVLKRSVGKFSSERLEKSDLPELRETIAEEFARPSRMDSFLTSNNDRQIMSSRFSAMIGGKRAVRIKKENKAKDPWPGEESILMNDKRKRNGVK